MSTSLWMGVWLILHAPSRRAAQKQLKESPVSTAFFGVSVYATYGLILAAMAYASDISYVVTFRQISIPLGAMMGVVILKESAPKPKVLGVTLAFIGLMMVGLG